MRLFVINTSSSSSANNKRSHLPTFSVTNLPRSCKTVCIITWRSQRRQHAMKPDIGRELAILPTPPAFDALVRGSRRNITVTFYAEKLEWCGYLMVKQILRYIYTFRQNTRTRDGQTDGRRNTTRRHRLRLCIASCSKNEKCNKVT